MYYLKLLYIWLPTEPEMRKLNNSSKLISHNWLMLLQ